MAVERPHNPANSAGRSETTPRHASAATSIEGWIEVAAVGLLACLLLFFGIVPGWRKLNTDFPNYYLVARLLHSGYALDRIYDWVWLQRIKDHWGLDQPLVGFAGLTPFSALPVFPLSFFSAIAAKRLWIVANLLFLSASIELVNSVVSIGRRRAWLLGLLAILPLCANFQLGQMHLLVLLLIVLAYFFDQRQNPALCGVCLGLAAALKVYPLFFGAYFLWKRQWSHLLSLVSTTLALLAAGWALFGSSVMQAYLFQGLPRSLQGEMLDPYAAQAASGAAFFHRLFIFEPALNPSPSLHSPLLYAMLYPLWQLAILLPLFAAIQGVATQDGSSHATRQLEWAALIVALLVLSPVPSSYHFVVLIFSMILLADVLLMRRRYGLLTIALALYGAVSLIGLWNVRAGPGLSLSAFLAFGRLWIVMFLCALLILCLWQERTPGTATAQRGLLLAVLCVAVWDLSFVGYRGHFAYFATDTSRRMPMPGEGYLATAPQAIDRGYLYVTMKAGQYRVLDQDGRPLLSGANRPSQRDQLSAGVSADRTLAAVELADVRASQIRVFSIEPVSTEPGGQDGAAVTIENAEDPALSLDGESLAFLREERGRGSLWWAQRKSLAATLTEPVQLVPDSYRVQDAAFSASGDLYFTGRAKGHTRIFRVSLSPGSQPEGFLAGSEDLGSPAFSPNGRYVAFTRLHHDRWQLAVMDLANRQERSLTFGDCNAYSPQWISPTAVAYGTDCARGLGLTAVSVATVR